MALPPCFTLADRVFTLVRQHAAHRMAATGRSQSEIGAALGVSQAMVSKYLKTPPPSVAAEHAWIVQQMAEELAHGDPGPRRDGAGTSDANPWCRTFAATLGAGHEDERHLVADLLTVLERIAALPVAPILPEVGMNLAGARENAQDRNDVAAFPGRLAHVGGRLRAHAPPEFGASHHLAALLVQAQRDAPGARFVANLAGNHHVLAALKASEEPIVEAEVQRRDSRGVPYFTAPAARFALIDKGGFGIEPATYLIDQTARGLAERLQRITGRMG